MSASLSSFALGDSRSVKHHRRFPEPLKRFAEAKKSIAEIYRSLETFVDELSFFYNDKSYDHEVIDGSHTEQLLRMKDSIKIIREMLLRDTMKVVFFGRTSNGKSSVINAMLHSKILPQGIGHTTCCFLQVEGTPEEQEYVLREDSSTRSSIDEIHSLGHAMSDENVSLQMMGQDSLLHVFIPKSSSRLLQNDVVLLDSPGVDLSPEFDNWIDKHCLDADVFVLVCNAESTLTQSEKSFFYRVSLKLSKPNVFILNNRWDASAAEMDHVQQIREQHMTRFKQFLVNELKVCTDSEAKNRIFFVSARETLDARLKEQDLISIPYQMEGYQLRAIEFSNFEAQFEEIISRSAIHTKFDSHERRAREILTGLKANLDEVQTIFSQYSDDVHKEYVSKTETLKDCIAKWKVFEEFVRNETKRLKSEVHLKVFTDFHEEIQRLDSIIDRFEERFGDDPFSIQEYKQALSTFVNEVVCQDLEARCTGGLIQRIWNLESAMFQHVLTVIGKEYIQRLEEIWRHRAPFRFTIQMDCPALMQDFREDLNFRFSLGPTSLIRSFIAYRSGRPVTSVDSQRLLRRLQMKNVANSEANKAVAVQSNADQTTVVSASNEDDSALVAQMVLSSVGYAANGGLGLIIVGGLLSRTIKWRYIAAGGLVYGAIYALEWWRWNSGAKEQHLKNQFSTHLATRMRDVAAAHTNYCENQVTNDMQQVFHGLQATAQGIMENTKSEIDNLSAKVKKLENVSSGLNKIKCRTSFLNSDLDRFKQDYLQADSLKS